MPEDNKEPKDHRFSSIVSDFYIDFLGSLVPGLFAIVLAGSVLYLSTTVLRHSLRSQMRTVETLSPQTQNNIVTEEPELWIGPYGTTAISLVLAYVMGSIFYRQDPKIPDHLSARSIWKSTKSEEDRKRLAVQPKTHTAEDITLNDAQFPYLFLYEYLDRRGLNHLAELIPWKGTDPDTWKYRTKMFLNQLKIRLQFLVPSKCKDIVRNEAHVRMATSVWYATRMVLATCAIALFLIFLACLVDYLHNKSFVSNYTLNGVFAFDLLVLITTWSIKFYIQKFLHYLRVREVIYVLETAYFANVNGFNMRFSDLLKNQKDETRSSLDYGKSPGSGT